jgi:hypothetical protein
MMEFPSSDKESEQSRKMKEELLNLLVRDVDPPNGSRNLSGYDRILKTYSDGLSNAERNKRIGTSADEFHAAVITALRICAKGWPSTTRQEVGEGIDAEVKSSSDGRQRNLPGQLSPHAIEQAIDFGLRTWLMFDCSRLDTAGKTWRWPKDMSIFAFVEEFVNGCFSPESSSHNQTTNKFPRKFTARNIDKIAGIKIQWTDFLSDHLAFNEEGGRTGTLSIFKQKRWLLEMEKLASSNASTNQLVSSKTTNGSQSCGGDPVTGAFLEVGLVTAGGGKGKDPMSREADAGPSTRVSAKNEDGAGTSLPGESSGHARQDDTLRASQTTSIAMP